MPARSPVSADPDAMDAVHPRALKRDSLIRPSSINAEMRRISPQIGLDTSTVIAGAGNSPTLRGFWKCSINCGLTHLIV